MWPFVAVLFAGLFVTAAGALRWAAVRRRSRRAAPNISTSALLRDNTDLLRERLAHQARKTIAADVLVRHHRQRGDDAFFLTGVDEHGTKVFRVAQREGLEPQEYVDRIGEVWHVASRSWRRAGLLHSHLGRGPQGVRA